MTTAPSVLMCDEEKAECNEESTKSVGLSDGMIMSSSEERKCVITNGICCNGCITKNIQVSVKRRVQNKKTLLWSDRSRKVTKPICVRGGSGHVSLANSGDRAMGMS